MILIPKDNLVWPQGVRLCAATGFKVPTDIPIIEIISEGIADQIRQAGVEPTHVLFGYGVRSRINPTQLPQRMIHGADEMFGRLKVRWVEGCGIELLTDIYKDA